MPRASRYLLPGYAYHLTQRCTDRQFLLRFARDREALREWLRVGVQRHDVPLYGYCITSNHIHLIVHVEDVGAVAMLMDLVAGSTASQYNRRKQRSGAFWEPYQCTIIEDGRHLFNCLHYVDLNMVRAGKVRHPDDWRWCGWSELTGRRKRYRLVDVERLLSSLDIADEVTFREAYVDGMQRRLEDRQLRREAAWTESLAVGSEAFVREAASRHSNRYELKYDEPGASGLPDAWTVRESSGPYSPI